MASSKSMKGGSLADLLKLYEGSLYMAKDFPTKTIDVLPLESVALRYVITRPGIPKEQILEIYGPPGAGKTTLANEIMRCGQVHYPDRMVAFVDAEGKYDLEYAKKCGLSTDRLLLAVPPDGEGALNIVIDSVSSGKFSVVVLDSIGSLAMSSALAGDLSDANVGIEAKIITRAVKNLVVAKSGTGTVIVLLNQVRAKIGGFTGFGQVAENRPGGYALDHHAGVILRASRGQKIMAGGKPRGYFVKVSCVKNSFGEPYRKGEVPLINFCGVRAEIEMLTLCKKLGYVKMKGGGHFTLTMPDTGEVINLGQGLLEAATEIKDYSAELTPLMEKYIEDSEAEARQLGDSDDDVQDIDDLDAEGDADDEPGDE